DVTGVLSSSAPTTPLGDWDADGNLGLTVKPSDMKPTEPNLAKYQDWDYPVTGAGLVLAGPVDLTLWSTPKLKKDQDLDYAAWLYDCPATGACTLITSTVN